MNTCLFPFGKFIYRDRKSQNLFRIAADANLVSERSSSTELNADLDSYIRKYNEEGVPRSTNGDDILIDLFPESFTDLSPSTPETVLHLQDHDPDVSTSSVVYTKVDLISSLLQVSSIASIISLQLTVFHFQNLEGKYTCKSCQKRGTQKMLKFHQITATTDIFKCESPICMFPFRNFIYRDREKQTYYRYKALSTTTESPANSSSQIRAQALPRISPQAAQVIPDIAEEVVFDLLPTSNYTAQLKPQPASNATPLILEHIKYTSRQPVAKLLSVNSKPLGQTREPRTVGKRIPTPLELIRKLLTKKEPVEESVAAESLSEAHLKLSQRVTVKKSVPTTIQTNYIDEPIKCTAKPCPPLDLPRLDEDEPIAARKTPKSPRKTKLVATPDKDIHSEPPPLRKLRSQSTSIDPTNEVLPVVPSTSRKRTRSSCVEPTKVAENAELVTQVNLANSRKREATMDASTTKSTGIITGGLNDSETVKVNPPPPGKRKPGKVISQLEKAKLKLSPKKARRPRKVSVSQHLENGTSKTTRGGAQNNTHLVMEESDKSSPSILRKRGRPTTAETIKANRQSIAIKIPNEPVPRTQRAARKPR